jgi:hypothetical protein
MDTAEDRRRGWLARASRASRVSLLFALAALAGWGAMRLHSHPLRTLTLECGIAREVLRVDGGAGELSPVTCDWSEDGRWFVSSGILWTLSPPRSRRPRLLELLHHGGVWWFGPGGRRLYIRTSPLPYPRARGRELYFADDVVSPGAAVRHGIVVDPITRRFRSASGADRFDSFREEERYRWRRDGTGQEYTWLLDWEATLAKAASAPFEHGPVRWTVRPVLMDRFGRERLGRAVAVLTATRIVPGPHPIGWVDSRYSPTLDRAAFFYDGGLWVLDFDKPVPEIFVEEHRHR